MVDTLLGLWARARVALYELAGAGAVVAGVTVLAGPGGGWIAGGVCLLAKSFEHDLRREG